MYDFAPANLMRLPEEVSHLPATFPGEVAGKCEEILWGLTRGSACGTTPG